MLKQPGATTAILGGSAARGPWKWATDKLDDARDDLRVSEKMAKVAWIVVAVLAVLSALQSAAIIGMLLS